MKFVIEVVISIYAEVIADAAAVGGDGLVVWNAIEAKQLLQAGEVGIGYTDGLFVGQPLSHVFLVGIATLGGALTSNEDEFHVVALGNPGSQFLAFLNSVAAWTAAHTPEVDKEDTAWVFGAKRADEVGHWCVRNGC